METRDKLNTLNGYQEIITLNEKFIFERFEDIKKLEESEKDGVQLYNRPNWEAIEYNYDDILNYKYEILLAKYSMGKDIRNVKEYFCTIIPIMEKSWQKSNGYVQIIWMLSVGIMLEIEDNIFIRLVHLIEKDNPNDFLIDFLISYRISSWEIKFDNFMFERPYQANHEIVSVSKADKIKGLKRLKKYLSKEWYRGHSDTGWYNDHKSKWNSHFGYWSFESGALVKILGLDDSSLKDMQYYPYDMVHWADEKSVSKHSWTVFD
jgi:hypothetical protein